MWVVRSAGILDRHHVRRTADRASGRKEIVWLEAGEHIDLYDVDPYVTEAAEVTADFLHRHL
jgi:fermentation-respiration switch protein FrsA (DUF1100 family)